MSRTIRLSLREPGIMVLRSKCLSRLTASRKFTRPVPSALQQSTKIPSASKREKCSGYLVQMVLENQPLSTC